MRHIRNKSHKSASWTFCVSRVLCLYWSVHSIRRFYCLLIAQLLILIAQFCAFNLFCSVVCSLSNRSKTITTTHWIERQKHVPIFFSRFARFLCSFAMDSLESVAMCCHKNRETNKTYATFSSRTIRRWRVLLFKSILLLFFHTKSETSNENAIYSTRKGALSVVIFFHGFIFGHHKHSHIKAHQMN